MYLSFDVGGTKTKYSLINSDGKILESNSISTKDDKEEIFRKVKEVFTEFQNKGYKIKGLAFSMPGVIDVERGYMITGGALYDLYDFPFKQELEKYISIPVAIVFADEPTGNLDSKNAQELHELFLHLREKFDQTFLIVTHNKELAGMSDRILTMKDGIIINE